MTLSLHGITTGVSPNPSYSSAGYTYLPQRESEEQQHKHTPDDEKNNDDFLKPQPQVITSALDALAMQGKQMLMMSHHKNN